jgi:toluene monooxygenase system ferredoxin subunit
MGAEYVMALADLWGGELVACEVGGDAVFLVKIGAAVHAYRDRCPHQGVPLSEGRLEGCLLTCRAHHHTFDVCAGRGDNPAGVPLTRYPVRIEGDKVIVSRPTAPASAPNDAAGGPAA